MICDVNEDHQTGFGEVGGFNGLSRSNSFEQWTNLPQVHVKSNMSWNMLKPSPGVREWKKMTLDSRTFVSNAKVRLD